jgi:hypothetical protein
MQQRLGEYHVLILIIGIRPLAQLRFCRFSGSSEPIFDSACGGNINGSKEPENRQNLSCARGLFKWLDSGDTNR